MLPLLRQRFLASTSNTIISLRELAAQLAEQPAHPAIIETLRRELHRIHGTAGTYGYAAASELASDMELRAISWAQNVNTDREQRGVLVLKFVEALEGSLSDEASTDEASLKQTTNTGDEQPPSATSKGTSEDESPNSQHDQIELPANIIVVEDDSALSDMLRYALESSGFSVQTFRTGPEALESLLKLDTQGRRTLILMDVDLPGMDGHSINERLRVQRPGVYSTVFVSARTSEAEQLRAFKAGAIDYITKPVSLRVLLAKVPIWLAMVVNKQ